MKRLAPLLSIFVPALLLAACGTSAPSSDDLCSGDKCDTPGGQADAECAQMHPGDRQAQQECRDAKALDHCAARKADALDSAQVAFVEDAIRWAVADVDGVNTNGRDDRGQEYTEYYAVVLPPSETEGGAAPNGVTLGRNQSSGAPTKPGLDLTEDQIFALEDEPDAIVGECVFTSWHADIRDQLPICGGSKGGCPELSFPADSALASWIAESGMDVPMTDEYLKMKIGFNSNGAASDLAERCMTEPLQGDSSNPDDPLHDDYTRGCMKAYDLFQTEWRRSDSAVCVAGGRLAECGCGVDTDADGIADITDPKAISLALVPRQPVNNEITLRGFPLGTWGDPSGLPAGCHYADTGDDSQTLVTCDLSASDVLGGAADVKDLCREKYGNNVVVHVPIPTAAIVCTPNPEGQYADTCGEMPWIVSRANDRN